MKNWTITLFAAMALVSCQLTSLKGKPRARYIVAAKTLSVVLNTLADARELKLISDKDWKNIKFANRQCKAAFIKWHYQLKDGDVSRKYEDAAMLALQVLQDYNKTYKKGE